MFSFDLNKLPLGKGVSYFLISFFSILGPFWYIFQYHRDLFDKFDIFKLLLLSACIGFPLVLLNAFFLVSMLRLISPRFEEDMYDPDAMRQHAAVASILTSLVFYLPLLVAGPTVWSNNIFADTFSRPIKINSLKALNTAFKIEAGVFLFIVLVVGIVNIKDKIKSWLNQRKRTPAGDEEPVN